MDEKQTLNRQEAAEFLGICPSNLDKLTAKGVLPRIKLGRRVLFLTKDLQNLLDSRREFRVNKV